MSKIENMNDNELLIELEKIRSDVQYLGEKLDRKRSWRDRLIRECWHRGLFKPVKNDAGVIVGSEVE